MLSVPWSKESILMKWVMLQNLLYQETWRESFSNTGCTHSPAVLEVVQGRGLPGRWLPHPVQSSVFMMEECKAFMSCSHLLSSLISCHKPYSLSRLKEFLAPKLSAKFLPLSLCPCGSLCLVVLSPSILIYSLASALTSDVQSFPWAISHRVMSSFYMHRKCLEFSSDKCFTSMYINIAISVSSLYFSPSP